MSLLRLRPNFILFSKAPRVGFSTFGKFDPPLEECASDAETPSQRAQRAVLMSTPASSDFVPLLQLWFGHCSNNTATHERIYSKSFFEFHLNPQFSDQELRYPDLYSEPGCVRTAICSCAEVCIFGTGGPGTSKHQLRWVVFC